MKKLILSITCVTVAMISYGQDHGNTTGSGTIQTESYGDQAGTSSNYSNYFGYRAGQLDSGENNSFFGWSTGRNNTGSFNTFIGRAAGHYNQGDRNVFIGHGSGTSKSTGNQNAFLGTYSGYNNTTGGSNTFIGFDAGRNNIIGGGNVFLGHSAGKDETGSHKLYIDNTGTTEPLIYGDFNLDYVSFNGNVGIGTTSFVDGTDTYALSVEGGIRAHSVKVYTSWADYVFEKDYALPTLEDVEVYIRENGHLKDIPSAKEVEASGIELGEMNKLLLQKIEELTLYTIALKKEVDELKTKID